MKERLNALNDKVWTGVIIGSLVPVIPGAFIWFLIHRVSALRGANLLLIACIALNALLMNYFFKLNKDNIARGIISVTFLWAFAFFVYRVV